MILSTTLFIFLIGFLILFTWMKVKYKTTWDPIGVIASACVCATVSTMLLYAVLGYVIFLMSMALAFVIVVSIILGGVWLADKVFR